MSLQSSKELVDALSSPTTCNNETTQALRQFLAPRAPSPPPIQNTRQTRTKTTRVITSGKKTAKPVKLAEQKSLAVYEEQELYLGLADQKVLAVDVVNKVLRSLTNATDNRVASAASPREDTSPSPKYLHDASGNLHSRTFGYSELDKRKLRGSSDGTALEKGLVEVANCGILAFEFLQISNNVKGDSHVQKQPRLESGLYAFIGRLIDLRMKELAVQELRKSHEQLTVLLGCKKPSSQRKDTAKGHAVGSAKIVCVANLLAFERISGCANEVLPSLVSHQTLVLKYLASFPNPLEWTEIIVQLRRSSASSPINLLQAMLARSDTKDGAARKLDILAKLIFMIASTRDVQASDKLPSIGCLKFEMQTLALETHLLWMGSSNHCGNLDTEILRPFSKYVTSLTRSDNTQHTSTFYSLVKQMSAKLMMEILHARDQNGRLLLNGPFSVELRLQLSRLAENAGAYDEALDILDQNNDEAVPQDTVPSYSCIRHCRRARIILKNHSKSKSKVDRGTLSVAMAKASDSLRDTGRGTDSQLKQVMEDMNSLRSGITIHLRMCSKSSDAGISPQDTLEHTSMGFFIESLRFIRKYAAIMLHIGADKPSASSELSYLLVCQVSQSTIESILQGLNTTNTQYTNSWAALDDTLAECLSLCELLEGHDQQRPGISPALRSTISITRSRISSAYWSHHVKLRRDPSAADSIGFLPSIQRCCEVLKKAHATEQLSCALPYKLYKLGRLLLSRSMVKDARSALDASISNYIELGTLHTLDPDLPSESPAAMWTNNERPRELATTLKAYLDLNVRTDGLRASIFYDDVTLAEIQRGLLLEYQLSASSSNVSALDEEQKLLINDIAARLLDVCSGVVTSVQLLRTTLHVLRLSNDEAGLISSTTISRAERLADGILDKVSKDGVEPRAPIHHLQALLGVHLTLRKSDRRLGLVQEAVAFWQSVTQEPLRLDAAFENLAELPAWTRLLSTLSDYLEMQGATVLSLAVLEILVRLVKVSGEPGRLFLVHTQCKLTIQYSNLGFSCKAGACLSKAERHLQPEIDPPETRLRVSIAAAEHYLALRNLGKANEATTHIQSLLVHVDHTPKVKFGKTTLEGAILTADAFRIVSRARLQVGALPECLLFAKKSVNILQYAWARLESHSSKVDARKKDFATVTSLVTDMSRLVVHSVKAPQSEDDKHEHNHPSRRSSSWPLINGLCRVFLNFSRALSHFGSFQDAAHYAQQAFKLTHGTMATGQLAEILLAQGDYANCAGKLSEGKALLDRAYELYYAKDNTANAALYHCLLGGFHHEKRQWSSELKAYKAAEKIIQRIYDAQEAEGGKPAKVHTPRSPLGTVRTARPRIAPVKKIEPLVKIDTKQLEASKNQRHGMHDDAPKLLGILNNIKQLEASSYIAQDDLESAARVLAEMLPVKEGKDTHVKAQIANVVLTLRQALKSMTADPVFGVLSESTISYPATIVASPRESSHSAGKGLCTSSPCDRKITPMSPVKGLKQPSVKQLSFKGSLVRAHEQLTNIRQETIRTCSTATVYRFHAAAAELSMILSSTDTHTNQKTRPILVAHSLDLPKSVACERAQLLIELDLCDRPSANISEWPEATKQSATWSASLQVLQLDFLKDLPHSWTAISVTLSACFDHLYIVRYRSGQSPFILKLPLQRQNAQDINDEKEEDFGYADAKGELMDIIKSSDANVHQARDNPELMQSKGAKSRWWAEREALDQRLQTLLSNMENLWLGGFKGIFSRQIQRPELLARFQQSFEKILEKHLPSRQRASKRQQPKNVVLDPRIYELFVGLGDGADEETDLEEPLTDLLYFVVDIMQFKGEANAYDEIDFDAMIIDTVDAIHAFQDAVRTDSRSPICSHTILVLDKRLHAFPWESMSCLEGQSVSRVPSLLSLHSRILAMQQQNLASTTVSGYHISRSNGTYMLNPSGDLSNTQSRFQAPLDTLTSSHDWTSVVNRIPTEAEFAKALTSSTLDSTSVLLYFGHGSGAQYIRARTIKRLAPHCGVALLFGCSSASLTEAGQFEPYGTPKTYLSAGAPAVLGSLWDVTDGDVDKFAGGVLERWGLLEQGACTADVGSSGKGRGAKKCKQKGVKVARGIKMSLSDAVAHSRGDCYLRYLNGAAMVVYGVPVYLRDA